MVPIYSDTVKRFNGLYNRIVFILHGYMFGPTQQAVAFACKPGLEQRNKVLQLVPVTHTLQQWAATEGVGGCSLTNLFTHTHTHPRARIMRTHAYGNKRACM